MKQFPFRLAFIVALAVAASVFAQQPMHFGARINLGYASFWNTDISSGNTRYDNDYYHKSKRDEQSTINGLDDASGFAFGIGGAMLYALNPLISIQPEFLISYRSRSVESFYRYTVVKWYERRDESEPWVLDEVRERSSTYYVDASVSQWFIDIPVMFRYAVPTGLFFMAGPVISLNFSSEGEYQSMNFDLGDLTSTFVLGLEAGVGYSIVLGGGQQVDVDLRFHLGVTSLVADDINYMGMFFDETSPKDFNIMLGATYWFM